MEAKLTQDEKINLWIEALESGEYKQGMGMLCFSNEFCCLGVLCEVAIKNGLDIDTEKYDDGRKVYDGSETILTEKVASWIGLDSLTGEYGKEIKFELTANNDLGMSFKKIAETIREHKEELFYKI